MKEAVQIACEGADVLNLDQLEPFQGELKELSEEDAKRLTHEILVDGFSDPFNVWRNEDHFYLIDGHQRRVVLYALEKAGYNIPALPVVWVAAESFEQAKRKVLSQAAQYGRITFESLSEFIAPLASSLSLPEIESSFRFPEIDMSAFKEPPEDDSEKASKMADKAAELLEKWGVERGQIWEIPGKAGVHRVMCGDSTDDLPLLMQGVLGQMIFTDPPYGVGYDGGAKKRERLDGDEIGTGIYGRVLPCLSSVVDDEAPLYLWYADGHAAAAAAAAAAAGYQIVAQIIWAKNHAQFVTSAHYKGKHEPCYYGHKKGKQARWFGPNNEVTLWEYDRSSRNDFHPTQKPVVLAARAICNSTERGQIVVDGFLGGGTTVVAAEQEGRICYGMEIEPKYVAVVLERMTSHGLEPRLLDTNAHS